MKTESHTVRADEREWQELLESVRSGRPVRLDSREVQPGDVFVALRGAHQDGARFVPDALNRGAAIVVGPEHIELPEESRARLFRRADLQDSLGDLARASFGTERLSALLIGITGTNGKTTVAYMLERLFREAGRSVGVIGTVSYRWPGHESPAALTTPDCLTLHALLSRMDRRGVDVVCMEVSSHALDQGRIAGLDFGVALFTNLSQDHLDYHADMEEYYLAKAKLFGGAGRSQPRAVLNLDDTYGYRLAQELPQGLGFSLQGRSNPRGEALQAHILAASRRGLHLDMRFNSRHWEITSPLIGRHNASNLSAAQAAGLAAGLSVADMKALNGFTGVPGRLEKVSNEKDLHIFVDYAHTPDALENVLSSVRSLDINRLFVVFGCGGDRDRTKRPLMGRAVAKHADVAVLTSDNPRNEEPEAIMRDVLPGLTGSIRLIQEADRRAAIACALQEITPEDALIIAGKGHEDYQEVCGQRHPFSDVQVVRELLDHAHDLG